MILAAIVAAMIGAPPVQTPIEAPGPLGPLRGTMAAGSGVDAPVVLIIPGSGPTDRDGNNRLGIKAGSYRLLAEALAAEGIGSVRIDKRGMFGSSAAVPDGNAVTIADYVQDVRAWTAAIKGRSGARCVWLLGHSEGGLVALAARGVSGICGLILVATAGRPLADVVKEQFRANPANAPVLDDALSAIDTLNAGKKVDVSGLHPALRSIFAPQVQDAWIDRLSYDPATLIAGYPKPVLILQGKSDLQVTVEDAQRLAHANSRAKLKLLPGVNHALKRVPLDDRQVNLATYADPNLPIAEEIVDAISAFVKGNASAS